MKTYIIAIAAAALMPTSLHAASAGNAGKCDPVFVTMNAVLTYATTMCDKDYMDTKVGIEAMKFAHECDAVLGMPMSGRDMSRPARIPQRLSAACNSLSHALMFLPGGTFRALKR
jgi:hypothetical protein